METVNTGIDMAMMYQPLILEYGAFQGILQLRTLSSQASSAGHQLRFFPVSQYFIFWARKIITNKINEF